MYAPMRESHMPVSYFQTNNGPAKNSFTDSADHKSDSSQALSDIQDIVNHPSDSSNVEKQEHANETKLDQDKPPQVDPSNVEKQEHANETKLYQDKPPQVDESVVFQNFRSNKNKASVGNENHDTENDIKEVSKMCVNQDLEVDKPKPETGGKQTTKRTGNHPPAESVQDVRNEFARGDTEEFIPDLKDETCSVRLDSIAISCDQAKADNQLEAANISNKQNKMAGRKVSVGDIVIDCREGEESQGSLKLKNAGQVEQSEVKSAEENIQTAKPMNLEKVQNGIDVIVRQTVNEILKHADENEENESVITQDRSCLKRQKALNNIENAVAVSNIELIDHHKQLSKGKKHEHNQCKEVVKKEVAKTEFDNLAETAESGKQYTRDGSNKLDVVGGMSDEIADNMDFVNDYEVLDRDTSIVHSNCSPMKINKNDRKKLMKMQDKLRKKCKYVDLDSGAVDDEKLNVGNVHAECFEHKNDDRRNNKPIENISPQHNHSEGTSNNNNIESTDKAVEDTDNLERKTMQLTNAQIDDNVDSHKVCQETNASVHVSENSDKVEKAPPPFRQLSTGFVANSGKVERSHSTDSSHSIKFSPRNSPIRMNTFDSSTCGTIQEELESLPVAVKLDKQLSQHDKSAHLAHGNKGDLIFGVHDLINDADNEELNEDETKGIPEFTNSKTADVDKELVKGKEAKDKVKSDKNVIENVIEKAKSKVVNDGAVPGCSYFSDNTNTNQLPSIKRTSLDLSSQFNSTARRDHLELRFLESHIESRTSSPSVDSIDCASPLSPLCISPFCFLNPISPLPPSPVKEIDRVTPLSDEEFEQNVEAKPDRNNDENKASNNDIASNDSSGQDSETHQGSGACGNQSLEAVTVEDDEQPVHIAKKTDGYLETTQSSDAVDNPVTHDEETNIKRTGIKVSENIDAKQTGSDLQNREKRNSAKANNVTNKIKENKPKLKDLCVEKTKTTNLKPSTNNNEMRNHAAELNNDKMRFSPVPLMISPLKTPKKQSSTKEIKGNSTSSIGIDLNRHFVPKVNDRSLNLMKGGKDWKDDNSSDKELETMGMTKPLTFVTKAPINAVKVPTQVAGKFVSLKAAQIKGNAGNQSDQQNKPLDRNSGSLKQNQNKDSVRRKSSKGSKSMKHVSDTILNADLNHEETKDAVEVKRETSREKSETSHEKSETSREKSETAGDATGVASAVSGQEKYADENCSQALLEEFPGGQDNWAFKRKARLAHRSNIQTLKPAYVSYPLSTFLFILLCKN